VHSVLHLYLVFTGSARNGINGALYVLRQFIAVPPGAGAAAPGPRAARAAQQRAAPQLPWLSAA